MKNLVRMFALPLAAFALASAGAVSTNSKDGNATADIQGWYKIDENSVCTELRMCNNEGTVTCKLAGVEAFIRTSPSVCNLPLFHRN